jgi:hypothetical protein
MHPAVRPAVSVLLISLSVLGLMNVYGDNSDVEAMARETACPGCESSLTRLERTPISQTFHFQTDKAGLVVVECQRAGIFLGSFACKKQP